ncbi:MAG: phenylalanine--tRNA ligase subunit beta, partial [Idiomarina sp.]|nr:phenylalanine--tRNA ligase subunit beta [Idiomarina sp.]
MKFSEQWLREWVSPELTSEQLAEQLSMAGLEVDGIEPVAAKFNNVFVGEVVECGPHPDADKLQVTKVSVGGDELLDIVCGAPNCRQGLKVVVATVGATLPGDFKIKKAKLRGQPSHGMLCSSKELGLDDD